MGPRGWRFWYHFNMPSAGVGKPLVLRAVSDPPTSRFLFTLRGTQAHARPGLSIGQAGQESQASLAPTHNDANFRV